MAFGLKFIFIKLILNYIFQEATSVLPSFELIEADILKKENEKLLAVKMEEKKVKRTINRIIFYILFIIILLAASYTNKDKNVYLYQSVLRELVFSGIDSTYSDVKFNFNNNQRFITL